MFGFLSKFLPGTWWLYLVAAGVIATTSAAGAWQFQEMRYGNKAKDRVQAELDAERGAFARQERRQQAAIDAANAARAREVGNRVDAAATRDAYSRMLIASSAAAERAKASHDACIVATAAFKTVYDNCTGRYTELGENSQRHVNDIQTLTESWPK